MTQAIETRVHFRFWRPLKTKLEELRDSKEQETEVQACALWVLFQSHLFIIARQMRSAPVVRGEGLWLVILTVVGCYATLRNLTHSKLKRHEPIVHNIQPFFLFSQSIFLPHRRALHEYSARADIIHVSNEAE